MPTCPSCAAVRWVRAGRFKLLCGVLFGAVLCGSANAQGPAAAKVSTAPTFHGYDVISVKPNKSGNGNMSWRTDDTSMLASNITVKMLLSSAFGIRDALIFGLPPWAESGHWDVQAKIVDPDPALKDRKQTREESQAEYRAQILSILNERFKIKTHTETKVQPIYDLTVAKGGSKLKVHDDAAGKSGSMSRHNNLMTATGIPMSDFARSIEFDVGRSIVDKTGLPGLYDLELKWTREDQAVNSTDNGSADKPPVIFTALEEQLGLKLVPDKAPLSTLVVDSIDMPVAD